LSRFQNSITHCLSECDRCTGAYTDDGNVILLNCRCCCHKNDCKGREVMNKQIRNNHWSLGEDQIIQPSKG